MVFHCLQELHCPCHLEYWVPQFWQKKEVLILAIYKIAIIGVGGNASSKRESKLAIIYFR